MKKIEAIIRPEKLEELVEQLEAAGYDGMTVTEVSGHGRQKGIVEQFRGKEYKLKFIPKVKLEMVVKNNGSGTVEKIVQVICSVAYTGAVGDGKIFISTIDDVVRVRTKERGEIAI